MFSPVVHILLRRMTDPARHRAENELFQLYHQPELRSLPEVAWEYASQKIRVNTVCPGVVPTDINKGQPYLETTASVTRLGRIATAVDIANAVLFLVADTGSFITGVDLPVDGGFILGKAG